MSWVDFNSSQLSKIGALSRQLYIGFVLLWLMIMSGCGADTQDDLKHDNAFDWFLPAQPFVFHFSLFNEEIQEAAFTPYYWVNTQIVATPSELELDDVLDDRIKILAIVEYIVYLDSVIPIEQGQVSITLTPVTETELHGPLTLSVALPLHGLSADRLEVAWQLTGWQPLFDARVRFGDAPSVH